MSLGVRFGAFSITPDTGRAGIFDAFQRLKKELDWALLLVGLRNLLGAGSVFLLLACGIRFCLFMSRLLDRGFRRFVADKLNAKVQDNRRQTTGGGLAPAESRLMPVLRGLRRLQT